MSIEKDIVRVWERIYGDGAYTVALTIWLIEHPADAEADEEIAGILREKPWLTGVVMGVMEAWS